MTTLMNQPLILGSLGSAVLGWLMFLLSLFLILLILVQRGKGGGLTGALGGPGGQSAFGSKAGDTFTLITAVSAIVWGLVCAIAMYSLGVPPLTADDEDYQVDDTPVLTMPADETAGGNLPSGLSGFSEMLDNPTEESATEGTETESDAEAGTGTPSKELTPAEPPASDSTEPATAEPATAESTEADSPAPETTEPSGE